jgi:hypothetical protein
VGERYRRSDGALIEIVANDGDDGTIDVQYFDGTVEELDADAWDEQQFEEAEAPEDWTGSVDVEPEDYESELSAQTAWVDPLESLDRSEASGYSEWPSTRAP